MQYLELQSLRNGARRLGERAEETGMGKGERNEE